MSKKILNLIETVNNHPICFRLIVWYQLFTPLLIKIESGLEFWGILICLFILLLLPFLIKKVKNVKPCKKCFLVFLYIVVEVCILCLILQVYSLDLSEILKESQNSYVVKSLNNIFKSLNNILKWSFITLLYLPIVIECILYVCQVCKELKEYFCSRN